MVMQKRIAALVAALVVIFSMQITSFGSEISLSLEEAIAVATKDNPQFISADTKIKNAQKQLDEAKRDQKNVKGVIRLPDAFSLVAVKQGYYVEQAKMGLECAIMEKSQAEKKLAYEVTEKYYSVKLSESLYKNAEDTYNIALENKNAVDIQFSLGLVAELDVNKADYALMQAGAMRDSYGRNLDIARKNLLISLQLDENTKMVLTDGIEYEEFTSDVEADIESAMNTRIDIYSLKTSVALADKYRSITKVLGEKSAEYSAANQSYVQSEYTYTNTKKLIGVSIYSMYNNILNARDSLKLAETNLALREKEYNIAKLQEELGLITNTQLMSALSSVSAAKIELENAKLTYKLAVKKYGYETETGL